MAQKTRILFLSANPWTTSRILVDEEAREIFAKLQEGPFRDRFELQKHAATRAHDLQRLLMMYKPHIVHFSVHGSKRQKLILGGTAGRGKEVDRSGLADLFALYRKHVRLVFLNACFTRAQAQSLCQVIDYSVGTGKMIGDKGGVAFAGAFYRALGFGKSISEAFQSAKAELALTKMPRSNGLELFVREGLRKGDSFPKTRTRGKRRRSERQTNRRTSSEVGRVPGRCGDLLQHQSKFSPSSNLVSALLHTRVRDGSRRPERRCEQVSSVRTEAIVRHRYSSASLETGPLPAFATAAVRVVRIVRTESFDFVLNTFEKE